MANITINGLPVIETRLQLPRYGNWTADVVVQAQTAAKLPAGSAASVAAADGALTFAGTIYRVDTYAQTVTLRMVGGKNGLARLVSPRFYRQTSIGGGKGTPLLDALADGGEGLSAAADQASLQSLLAAWVMLQQPVANALSSLALAGPAGCVWRMQPDGTVFFGVDSFLASGLTDYELLEYLPQENIQVIAAEVPSVFPGQSFAGKNVSVVEHQVGEKGSIAKLWFE